MNGHMVKKLKQLVRRMTKKDWDSFIEIFWDRVAEQPLRMRIRIAWRVLWGKRARGLPAYADTASTVEGRRIAREAPAR